MTQDKPENRGTDSFSKVPRASSAEQIQHAPSSDRSLPGERNDDKKFKDQFVPAPPAPGGEIRSEP